jgi:hypothetical protein
MYKLAVYNKCSVLDLRKCIMCGGNFRNLLKNAQQDAYMQDHQTQLNETFTCDMRI